MKLEAWLPPQALKLNLKPTCPSYIAGCVHFAEEELKANDGVDDDDEEDQQSNVEKRNHGFNDGVQHYL